MINFATLLTQQQVERTHAASLEILENVGLLVRNENACMIFKQYGCKVDPETQIVTTRKLREDPSACLLQIAGNLVRGLP